MDQDNTQVEFPNNDAIPNSAVTSILATQPLVEKITHIGKKILIVEDEDSLANALKLKLSASGYIVTVADNGEDGYELAASQEYDLILLDLILPQLDGFAVLQKLKDSGNTKPVIVLSNLSQEEDIAKVKDLGAIDFLVKSNIQLSKVLEYLNKIL